MLARMAARADIVMLSGAFVQSIINWSFGVGSLRTAPSHRLRADAIRPRWTYRDFKSTDLTQMALGGIMAMCGYDADQNGIYDTPPIAPSMWHSFLSPANMRRSRSWPRSAFATSPARASSSMPRYAGGQHLHRARASDLPL